MSRFFETKGEYTSCRAVRRDTLIDMMKVLAQEQHMEIKQGWLSTARHCQSENCDERPTEEVSLLVIHCISLPAGHFGNRFVEALFTNQLDVDCYPDFADLKNLHVASHLFIRRDGTIVQFVPFQKRAWHAGVSSFAGREACNDFSIGIELEGTDSEPFTDFQYDKLMEVCRLLTVTYNIPLENIVGHSDIAPGRKTDPGVEFDWQRLRAGVSGGPR